MEKNEKSISSDLIRGHIDTIILYSLLDGDKFAQQISDAVNSKSEGKYELNQATLYSCLKRLENLKLVSAYWHDSEGGRRRFFKLTDEGKFTVEQNLSNWTYSRAIIDKLTDTELDGGVKTEVVEKIVTVEKPVYIEKIVEKPVEVVVEKPVEVIVEKPVEVPVSAKPEPEKNEESTDKKPLKEENTQEINFRNILNGLIRTTAKEPEQKETLEPIEKVDYEKTTDKVFSGEREKQAKKAANFNDIISSTQYSPVKKIKSTVDFSDMIADADREGYTLRVSNSEPCVIKGEVFGNKLNFISALAVFIIAILEMLAFTLLYKDVLNLSAFAVVAILVVLSIYPIFATAIYIKNPKKTVKPVKVDSILTALIVVFNLILITFAVNLLVNTDFNDTFSLLAYFVCPSVFFFDILLMYIIRFFVAKTASCSALEKKKPAK